MFAATRLVIAAITLIPLIASASTSRSAVLWRAVGAAPKVEYSVELTEFTGNSNQSAEIALDIISITNTDVALESHEGALRARVNVSADGPIREIRVAQRGPHFSDPLYRIPWQPYTSGVQYAPVVKCNPIMGIAVQVRGDDITTNSPIGPQPNISAAKVVEFAIPEDLQPALSTSVYQDHASPNVPFMRVPDPLDNCEGSQCLIRPGRPSSNAVQVLGISFDNFVGGLDPSSIVAAQNSCIDIIAAHRPAGLVQEPGRPSLYLDVKFTQDVCMPKIYFPSCTGRLNKHIPVRFERVTTIHENTAAALQSALRFEGADENCRFEAENGDIGLRSSSGSCNVRIRRNAGFDRIRLRWASTRKGNCQLVAPIKLSWELSPLGLLVGEQRKSSFHPAYDDFPDRQVTYDNLTLSSYLEFGQSHRVQHACVGFSANGGSARTYIDRAEISSWVKTPVVDLASD